MSATWHTGDTLTVLRTLPDNSVDLVLTSPPFLALRSYLPDDDPAKVHEIGQEPTPGEFIDALLDITEEARRVLAPHGSICVELGDTYAGSGGAGGDYNDDGLRDGQPAFSGSARKAKQTDRKAPRGEDHDVFRREQARGKRNNDSHDGWPNDKSLTLIPELYRLALAYGINPLTGRTTPRWRIRNVIRWVRPNPPVGALGDKFRPGTTEMVVATGIDEAGRTRYFDLDAVRPADPANKRPSALTRQGIGGRTDQVMNPLGEDGQRIISNPAGAPPLDWWQIPTKGYKGAHYATFPPALCEKPIKAMCPERVCTTCGEPSRRIVESDRCVTQPQRASQAARSNDPGFGQEGHTTYTTIGWTDCGHDTWRPGIVLDPFAGSGTVGQVATGHGRDTIGIDLDTRNVDLARERIGPMFFHLADHPGHTPPAPLTLGSVKRSASATRQRPEAMAESSAKEPTT